MAKKLDIYQLPDGFEWLTIDGKKTKVIEYCCDEFRIYLDPKTEISYFFEIMFSDNGEPFDKRENKKVRDVIISDYKINSVFNPLKNKMVFI